MKAIEMKPYIVYRAIKCSSDGSISSGDIMWLSQDGVLCLPDENGGGCLNEDEWKFSETVDFEVEETSEYYVEQRQGREFFCKKD